MVGTLVRPGSFLVRSGRLRSGHGTKCLETGPIRELGRPTHQSEIPNFLIFIMIISSRTSKLCSLPLVTVTLSLSVYTIDYRHDREQYSTACQCNCKQHGFFFFVYMHYSCRVYQNINMYYIYIICYIMFHIVLLYC